MQLQNTFYVIKSRLKKWIAVKSHQPLYTDEQMLLFEKLRPGDIVYARMPLADIMTHSIPQGHQNRPYLIVEKNAYSLIAYPSSHKVPENMNSINCFVMKKEIYHHYHRENGMQLNVKDSYFDLSAYHELPIENLIAYSTRLMMHDLQEVGRKLMIAKNNGTDVKLLDVELSIQEGDVCSIQGALWYVYRSYHRTLYVLPVYKQQLSKEMMRLDIKDEACYLNLSSCKQLNNVQGFPVIWTCNRSMIALIDNKKKALRHQLAQTRSRYKKTNPVRYKMLYPMGQQFYFQFNNTVIIYLYNIRDRAYGIYLDEFQEGILKIHGLDDFEYMRKGEMTDMMQLNKIKKAFVRSHKDTHQVLGRILNKENQLKESSFISEYH